MRYIGKTSRGLSVRHAHHVYEARRGHKTYFSHWLAKHPEQTPVILAVCRTEQDALQTEVEMIALARLCGEPLTNYTDGGEGATGHRHSLESRAKMSAKQSVRTKQPHLGHRHTTETRRQISETKMGSIPWNRGVAMWSEADRQRISFEMKNRIVSDGTRQKMSAARIGEKNVNARLTESVVREMRLRNARGETGQDLAHEFGVSHSSACRAIKGETWKAVI